VVPKAAQEVHMRQNLQLSKLPEDCLTAVDRLSVARGGPVRFSDPANHIGFDIFDEEKDQPVGNIAPWD
jgi:alcohol dehydrogenase (NADP+)